MGRASLASINPPHTDNIFSFKKSVEWRTQPMPTGKQYCYETIRGGGCGKVIGEYVVLTVSRYENVSSIPNELIYHGCVPPDELERYSKGKALYAHILVRRKKYDVPKELWEFKTKCKEYGTDNPLCDGCNYYISGMCYEYDESDCGCNGKKPIIRPPQSWCYVEDC